MIFLAIAAAAAFLVFQNKDEIVETVETHLDFWTAYDNLFKNMGASYGVDWKWLKAIALNESDLGRVAPVAVGIMNPKNIEGSKSSDGKSWGLMQVTITTARDMDPFATEEKLNDPNYSVMLAAKYIQRLKTMFSSLDPKYTEYVIKSYNQGPGNTKKEILGTSSGFAKAYWERWQRNLNRVEESLDE